MKAVCVFCGSSSGAKPAYQVVAQELGAHIANRELTLVYGGGDVGLMGTVADAAMKAGGRVIGVIPKSLADKEVAHRGISELHVVDSMHQRKAMMANLADAFIAMPGGFGTLEEFCEIVTWSQLGFHQKPCGILNVEGYFDALLQQFDRGVDDSFIRSEHREIVVSATDPDRLLDQLAATQVRTLDKWIE